MACMRACDATAWRSMQCAITSNFRTIEAHRRQALPQRQAVLSARAALDQEDYPETICSVPSVAFLEDQFRKAKELGLNALRFVISRCLILATTRRRIASACSSGQSCPTSDFPAHARVRARCRRSRACSIGMGNYPDLRLDARQRELGMDRCMIRWTARSKTGYVRVSEHDPAGWWSTLAGRAQFPCPHRSCRLSLDAAILDRRAAWDDFVGALAARAPWLFSPEGDADSPAAEPLIRPEFGNSASSESEQLWTGRGESPGGSRAVTTGQKASAQPHGAKLRFATGASIASSVITNRSSLRAVAAVCVL